MSNTSTYLPLAAGLLVVTARLWVALHRVAPGIPRAVLAACAGVVLAGLVSRTVRTARQLKRTPAPDAERAVYNLAFVGLLVVALALTLPDFFVR